MSKEIENKIKEVIDLAELAMITEKEEDRDRYRLATLEVKELIKKEIKK